MLGVFWAQDWHYFSYLYCKLLSGHFVMAGANRGVCPLTKYLCRQHIHICGHCVWGREIVWGCVVVEEEEEEDEEEERVWGWVHVYGWTCVHEKKIEICLATSYGHLPSKFRDLGGFRDLLFLLFLWGLSLSTDPLRVSELGAGGRGKPIIKRIERNIPNTSNKLW